MGAAAVRQPIVVLGLIGAVLDVAALASPSFIPDADSADLVTRQTARVAILFWGLAAAILLARTLDFRSGSRQTSVRAQDQKSGDFRYRNSALMGYRDWARAAWTVGCVTFLIHVATAFDRVHGWSHGAAYRHVESVSGFGAGLFVSYAFTIIWVADTIWWWLNRRGYEGRPVWLDRTVHVFFAFIVFNGTVVYETGLIRWAGIVLFAVLGSIFAAKRLL